MKSNRMAFGRKKRSFADFAAGSEPTLTVITADGGRIPAHNEVLRLVCSCLRNAPASDTWDLSSLVVNGSPVSQQTVTSVLHQLYANLGAFEVTNLAGQYSLSQLLGMLLFADAVGCGRAVLRQLAGLLGSTVRPQLEVKLPASKAGSSSVAACNAEAAEDSNTSGRHVALQLDGVYSHDDGQDDEVVLRRWQGRRNATVGTLTMQQFRQLQQHLSQQLEALLFVGFKLDLQQLLQPALRFLRASAPFLMHGVTGPSRINAMFTPRVLAAAGGATGAELLSRSYLQVPLGLGFGIGSMFADVEYVATSKGDTRDYLSFTATLMCDLYEFSAGVRVGVSFGGCDGAMHIQPAPQCSSDSGSNNEDGEEEIGGTSYSFGVVLGPMHSFPQSYM